jgi:hypothetical protein
MGIVKHYNSFFYILNGRDFTGGDGVLEGPTWGLGNSPSNCEKLRYL